MRFMMLMIPKVYAQAGPIPMPSAELVGKMMKYNEELSKAGVLLALDGLQPGDQGAARIHFSGGKATATDGPFTETKELLGGYWMIQVRSKEEAVEWALRCPAEEGDIIEVRRVQEIADFPAEIQETVASTPLNLP